MTSSTKYCLTAILCTLMLAAAYMVINRWEQVRTGIQIDRWTGTLHTWKTADGSTKITFLD